MRIAHIGDIHLRPDARNHDRRRALGVILEELRGDGSAELGAILVPGDLNHGAMSIDDRNWLADWLTNLAYIGPVIVVPGNHDRPGDLDVFGRLNTYHAIHVAQEPGVIRLHSGHQAGGIGIAVLPYPRLSRGIAAGEDDELLAGVVQGLAVELRELPIGWHSALAGHVTVGGAVTSTGQPVVGQELSLPASALAALPESTYAGFNHIHRPQSIGRAVYAGSVCRLDWGELEPKRYLVVDLSPVDAPVVLSRPLEVPPGIVVDGQWDVSAGEFCWSGARVADAPSIRDVRVRYRYPASVAASVDHHAIRELFSLPGVRELKLEPICEPDAGARSQAVQDAGSLSEKLFAWARDVGLPGRVTSERLDAALAECQEGEHAG